jgi:hypothetical protein
VSHGWSPSSAGCCSPSHPTVPRESRVPLMFRHQHVHKYHITSTPQRECSVALDSIRLRGSQAHPGRMLSSLLRPKRRRILTDWSPFASPFNMETAPLLPHHSQQADQGSEGDENTDEEASGYIRDASHQEGEERENPAPLLPIFSAPHLGKRIHLDPR